MPRSTEFIGFKISIVCVKTVILLVFMCCIPEEKLCAFLNAQKRVRLAEVIVRRMSIKA